MDTTLIDLIMNGRYLPAVGVMLVLFVSGLRAVSSRLSPWFATKIGGYVLAYASALGLYIGTALQSGTAIDANLIIAAIITALTSSGILDHWRDVVDFSKKNPPIAKAGLATLLVAVACTACPGTSPTGGSIVAAFVDCTDHGNGVFAQIEQEIIKMGGVALSDDPDKWNKIEILAINDGLQIGGCAASQVVNDWITKKSLHDADAVIQTHLARDMFERYRNQHAGGASFRTPRGDL